MKNKDGISWEYWLLVLGVRSLDSAYNLPEIEEHFDYFKEYWRNGLPQYKALDNFSKYLDETINI